MEVYMQAGQNVVSYKTCNTTLDNTNEKPKKIKPGKA